MIFFVSLFLFLYLFLDRVFIMIRWRNAPGKKGGVCLQPGSKEVRRTPRLPAPSPDPHSSRACWARTWTWISSFKAPGWCGITVVFCSTLRPSLSILCVVELNVHLTNEKLIGSSFFFSPKLTCLQWPSTCVVLNYYLIFGLLIFF